MWDTFRDVPSIETPGVSVLDEYYWLNKHDPNYSLCRATVNCGKDAHTDKKFELDKESAMALSKLFLTPERILRTRRYRRFSPTASGVRISGCIGRQCSLSSAGRALLK